MLDVAGGTQLPYFVDLPETQGGTEGTPISFTVDAVDPAGNSVLITADNLPPGASFDPKTDLFTWTPGYTQAGTYPSVVFSVTDGTLTSTEAVQFSIAYAPQPVTLAPVGEHTLSEGDKIVLTPAATAAAGATLAYSADTLPFGATLDATTGRFSWTPGYDQHGDYTFDISVTDGTTTASQPVELDVLNANGAPSFESLDGLQTFTGQAIGFQAFAFDPDNPDFEPSVRDASGNLVDEGETDASVTVSVVGALPPGATFDPGTWLFSWTPTAAQAGVYSVTFMATDDGDGTGVPLTTTVTTQITVLPLDQPPVIAPVSNISVAEGAVGGEDVTASDPQGRALGFQLLNDAQGYPLPSFITLTDNGTGTAHITVAPQSGDRSNTTVDLLVTSAADASGPALVSEVTFVIAATALNEAPVVAPLGDTVAPAGTTITIPVAAGDADQNPLTYTVSGYAGASIASSTIYGQALLTINTAAGDSGDHVITVTATDDGNGGLTAPYSGSASFDLRVRGTDTAPVLAPLPDQALSEGQAYALCSCRRRMRRATASGYTAAGLPGRRRCWACAPAC